MYGYKIKLGSIPEPRFACSLSVDDYLCPNKKYEENRHHVIELSITSGDSITFRMHNKHIHSSGKTFLVCIVDHDDVDAYADTGVRITIDTVAVFVEDLDFSMGELSEDDFNDQSVLVIPFLTELESGVDVIERLIKSYISHSVKGSMTDRMMCTSLWFELVSRIDEIVRMAYSPIRFSSAEYYVKKVDSVIKSDYNKKLRLSKIAGKLGVTPNYLSAIYSSAAGQSFSKALNLERMKKAKELAYQGIYTNKEIAEMIGLSDECYMREQFRKCWGVSISECRRIENAVTLYHQEPLRNEK